MFNSQYFDWVQKRIKGIIDNYGHQFFLGKQVLDLGCGNGDIGGAFYRLGSTVTAVDARQEYLKTVSKKFPGIQIIRSDLDNEWPFNKKFDLILDMGLLCHLTNYESHLKFACSASNTLVLETAVLDSNDLEKCNIVPDDITKQDNSIYNVISQISQARVEKILRDCNMEFKRLDLAKFNSGPYSYNWQSKFDNSFDIHKRRIWFATKNLNSIDLGVLNERATFSQVPFKWELANQTQPNAIVHTGKQLRVALCLSGFARQYQQCLPNLRKYLLNNPNLQVDIFCHTWSSLDRHGGQTDYNGIMKDLTPKKLIVEKPFTFPISKAMMAKNYEKRDISGLLSMFYKIEACNNIKKQYEIENNFVYDAVIRFRFDLSLNSDFSLSHQTNLNKIQIPKWGDFGGLNDQVAFSGSSNMDKYSTIYSNFSNLLIKMNSVNPEIMLKTHIDQLKIEIERPEIDYFIWHKRTNNKDWEKKQGFIK